MRYHHEGTDSSRTPRRAADLRRVAASVVAGLISAAPAAAQMPHFTDAAATAGVRSVQWDGVPPANLSGLEQEFLYMVAGCAVGDFDKDGRPDLYVTSMNAPNHLFRNLGGGIFEDVADAAGVAAVTQSSACAWGDVDGDGWLNLYVLTFGAALRNLLYMNNGDGTFREDAQARGVDLAFTGSSRLHSGAAFGDYDRDGDLDLVVTSWGRNNRLFRNTGRGAFVDVSIPAGVNLSESWGFTPRFADVDGDGWPDLLLAGDFGTSRLFINNQRASFVDRTADAGVGTDANGMGSALGDVDRDGDLDWFVTAIFDPNDTCADASCTWSASGNRLYRNDSAPSAALFADVTDNYDVRDAGWGWAASFLDFNNDGLLDLAVAAGMDFPMTTADDPFNNNPLRLWIADASTQQMTDVAASVGFASPSPCKGLAVFDFDSDGDLDAFVTANAAEPVLLRNDGGNTRNWIQIDLQGVISNRFGVGARIFVQATRDGPVQMHEVSASSNYMSQNDLTAHFGIGTADSIHLIRVEWPRGALVSELSDQAANQRILIVETPCLADLNGDNAVTLDDLATLLANFGRTDDARYAEGDVTGDGTVGLDDLALLLSKFGTACQ